MPSAARAAKNERVFREVNERIHDLEERFEGAGGSRLASFVCECSQLDCRSAVEASLQEYQAVRSNPARFLVLPGHVNPDYERIVSETDRFVVVEKFGAAGELAVEEDT